MPSPSRRVAPALEMPRMQEDRHFPIRLDQVEYKAGILRRTQPARGRKWGGAGDIVTPAYRVAPRAGRAFRFGGVPALDAWSAGVRPVAGPGAGRGLPWP